MDNTSSCSATDYIFTVSGSLWTLLCPILRILLCGPYCVLYCVSYTVGPTVGPTMWALLCPILCVLLCAVQVDILPMSVCIGTGPL